MKFLILFSLLFSGAVQAEVCADTYKDTLRNLMITDDEENGPFGEAFMTAMFMPLAYGIGGATAGPFAAGTVGVIGSHGVTKASKRRSAIKDISKVVALINNIEAEEGSQLDSFQGDLLSQGISLKKSEVAQQIQEELDAQVYCTGDKMYSYSDILNSIYALNK